MSNSKDFNGKVVIVTGSSSGIGEGIALHLAKSGARVVVTGRNEENVKRVANQCQSVSPNRLQALTVIADLTNDDDMKRLIDTTIDHFGQLDVLVNNAGAGFMTLIGTENFMENYEKSMRLDIRAIVYLSHLAVPHLEKTKGNIISISSVGGIKPYPPLMAYCMAKSALDMFTKCAAIQLGPKGVRVNSINSGAVRSNFGAAMGVPEQILKLTGDKLEKTNFFGYPQDIANVVAFLASNEASFVNGSNVVVDGGVLWSNFVFDL